MAISQDSNDPTGVSSTDKGNSTLARARQRKANAAMQMKLGGANWEEICEVVGFATPRQARIAIEKALEKELKEDGMSKAHMRRLAGNRLERTLRAVWVKANDPEHPEQLAAMGRVREIMADHRKLYGLDAPSEHIVHTPTRDEMEALAARLVQGPTAAIEEADIFDGEAEWDEEETA